MVRRIAAVVACCGVLVVRGLVAEPSFLSDPRADGIRLQFSNDLFGPGPVEEFDDARTFAVEVARPIGGGFATEAGFELLTWRGMEAGKGGRIDVARALVARQLPALPVGPLHLDGSLEAGALVAGELGGLRLQRFFHEHMGMYRPVPERYDPFAATVPAAAVSARLRWERGPWGAAVLAGAGAELGVGARIGAAARLRIGSEGGSIGLGVRALRDAGRGVSPTLDRVSVADSGVVLRLACAAGRGRSFLENNLTSGVTNGGYGLSLGLGRAGSPHELPIGLEVSCPVACVAPGQRILLALRDGRLRLYASQASGWWQMPGDERVGLRVADYGAGVEARLLAGIGSVELEASASAGAYVSFVTLQTLEVKRSEMLGSSWSAGLRVEPAIRVGFLERGARGHDRKTGIGLGWVLDAPVPGSTAPPRKMHRLLLFAFGETR